MYPQYGDPPVTPGGFPPQPPRRKRHWVRWTAVSTGVLLVGIVAAGIASGAGNKQPGPVISSPATSVAVASQSPQAVQPSPDGTFTGSCSYELGDSPSTGTAQATGDIEAENTGNIGIFVKLTITWPQEGYAPLSLSKTVRLPQGGSRDVQFHMQLSGTQLDRLQNYQLGHSGDDGCTFNGSMTDTFGQPVG